MGVESADIESAYNFCVRDFNEKNRLGHLFKSNGFSKFGRKSGVTPLIHVRLENLSGKIRNYSDD